MNQPRKLLLIRTSAFGDVVQTFYVLSDIQRALPDIEISWCVDQRFADLAKLHPAVQRVIELPTRRWRHILREPRVLGEVIGWVRSMRSETYDLAIDLQGLYKSSMVGFLSRSKLRVGPEAFGSSERGVHFLYQRHIKGSKIEGLAARARYFVGAALDYDPFTYGLDSGVRCWRGGDRITLMVGASSPQKCWPVTEWVSLCTTLIEKCKEPVELLWGSEAEREKAIQIAAQVNSLQISVAPMVYDISALRALFLRSSVMVGGDTGLTHFAAALGVPTVMLFLKTSSVRYAHPELTMLIPADQADGPITADRVFDLSMQAMQIRII